MRDARPLKRRPPRPPRTPRPARSTAKAAKAPGETAAAARPARIRIRPAAPAPAAAAVAAKSDGGLDKRSAERLRLHGHTQADAHRAVHAFIAGSHRAGRRCVLIITGKGGPRDDVDSGFMPDRDSGVLRRNLPRWLGEGAVRQMVLRMESARPQHGGEGAYYVLLRRKR